MITRRLILDLDQTLVDSKPIDELYCDHNNGGVFELKTLKYRVYIRPYYNEFISVAEQLFDEIYIFSAGTQPYVEELSKRMFRGELLKDILHRASCNIDQYNFTTKVLANHQLDCANTFMIDDNPVYGKNEHVKPENGNFLRILPYDALSAEEDIELLSAIDILKKWSLKVNLNESVVLGKKSN